MKKMIIIIAGFLLLTGCTKKVNENNNINNKESANETVELPTKNDPNSVLMSESPITPLNIDNYLFREDCIYIDLRDPNQFHAEGAVAGFINIPFYGYIANFSFDENALYTMTKRVNGEETILLGAVGSFSANYVESDILIKDIFPQNKNIIIISTAGVEASYFISLLIQLGYDGSKLYNAGSFSNGTPSMPAYRTYEGAKYLVAPLPLYDTEVVYKWSIDMTKIENEDD
jgi:hypothetical protein